MSSRMLVAFVVAWSLGACGVLHAGSKTRSGAAAHATRAQPVAVAEPASPSPSPSPSPSLYWPAVGTPWLLSADESLTRGVARGDFESPDVLLVVYDTDWLPALRQLSRVARSQGVSEVLLLTAAGESRHDARRFARHIGARFLPWVVDTPWIRDYAPAQHDGDPGWLDFHYSDDRPLDDGFPTRLARSLGLRIDRSPTPFDGGGLVSNGDGLCVATELSLLDTGLDLEADAKVQQLLQDTGCELLVAVPALPLEETGHADMFVQFTRHDGLLIAAANARRHPDEAAIFDEATRRVRQAFTLRYGRPPTIQRVPMHLRDELHYSHVNGLRLGNVYLVPVYEGVPAALQQRALAVLSEAMPTLQVIGVGADRMIERAGAVHCITAGVWLPESRPALAALSRLPRGAGNQRSASMLSR